MRDAHAILLFCWAIPTVLSSAGLLFSESLGYKLQSCSATVAVWLRYVFLQQALLSFSVTSIYFMPRKYSIYFDRFLNQGHVSFALVVWFFFMQVCTPAGTLIIYLQFKDKCGGQITTWMSVYYWTVVGTQTSIGILSGILLFVLLGIFSQEWDTYRVMRTARKCSQQATKIINSATNPSVLYRHLLDKHPTWKTCLSQVDLLYFERHLAFRLDATSDQILAEQDALCSVCISSLRATQKVVFVDVCRHIFHWECFRSAFWAKQVCPFCEKLLLAHVKESVGRPVFLSRIHESLRVPPLKKPSNQVQDERFPYVLWRPRRRAQPIVTIEYFNYTVDQKTGGEPAEALPAPVAETEI